MSGMNLTPPRGTRDFFPDEMRLRNWLFGHFREVSRLFAFAEYDAPVVESAELFTRKAGEEIVDQLYTFQDKSGRQLALRPEMTPSLARLVLQKGSSLALPIKWFSIPQCWRYERMTRGRRREHFQWNLDIFGVPGVEAEAELISAVVTFFSRVGLGPGDVGIKVSNRKILETALSRATVPAEKFAEVCILVDKLDKVSRDVVEQEMSATGLKTEQVKTILDLLSLDSLDAVAAVVGEDHQGITELRRLFELAGYYRLDGWLDFDAGLVRGLAYYTGIVFEAFDRTGSLRAICGGGRYDRLLSTFGGSDLPACGLGFGDAVIFELLKDKSLTPQLKGEVDDVVFAFDATLRPAAIEVAQHLRNKGRTVDLVLEEKKMKWAFRRADQSGAARLVLVAPDEWAAGKVRVKQLDSGTEENLTLREL
jgi:histidyl-tRNA synthetase